MLDRTEIRVKAGSGGDGAISFRHEKFVPYGGPDGGDGGDGGSVLVRADAGVTSLRLFRRKRFFRAGDGQHGAGKKKHGKHGKDLVILVPLGTVLLPKVQVTDDDQLSDLIEPGQRVVVARGGKGGKGNVHFASATNKTPRLAQRGEAGEESEIIVELRLIADVGVIGYPNVGKSTLLAAVSAARPKIASYAFTTLEPVLGVVKADEHSLVFAEIPGLIAGAHLGRGLGHNFLRHVGRTKILLHLVDGSSAAPVEDMAQVNQELGLFDSALAAKPQLVAVSKVDLPRVRAKREELTALFGAAGVSPYFVSAVTGEGLDELVAAVFRSVAELRLEREERVARKVFQPRPRRRRRVTKEGNAFVITAPELERIVARVDMSQPEVYTQVRGQMDRQGIGQELKQAGVRPGDRVRCGDFEWDWR